MIYIITHKKFDSYFTDDEHYKVLHVGTNDNCDDKYLRDDIGDNISYKNKYYCELTGQYWIWKNVIGDENQITGIIHYRRYFTTRIDSFIYTYFHIKPKVLSWEKIKKSLRNNDIIVPQPCWIHQTIENCYARNHVKEDLYIVEKAIAALYPDYLEDYIKVLNGHWYIYANMLLTKKNIFDDYSKWLFNIMGYVEKRNDISKYKDDYQKRVYGFLSERLLQVWITHNNLKVKTYPVFNTEQFNETIFERNIKRFKNIINK